MAKMNSKFKYMFDAAPASTLIAKDGVAKTASFNSTVKVLDVVDGHWNTNELADQTFAIAVNVTALDRTSNDETYVLELEFGDADFSPAQKTHRIAVSAPGQYVFLVDADTVRAAVAAADRFRIAATLAGTTPSITLHAWMAGAIIR